MENYKDKYEKALERARVLNEKIKGGKGFTTLPNYTICETIFPELKESEDEKIRKEIIDYLKSFIPHHDDDLVARSKVWIAWLEKQGEQKSAWSEEDEKIFRALSNALARISLNTRTDSTSINYSFFAEIDWLKSFKDRMKGE